MSHDFHHFQLKRGKIRDGLKTIDQCNPLIDDVGHNIGDSLNMLKCLLSFLTTQSMNLVDMILNKSLSYAELFSNAVNGFLIRRPDFWRDTPRNHHPLQLVSDTDQCSRAEES